MSTEIGERRNHNVIGDVRYMKKEDIRRRLQQLNSICQEYNLKNLSERIDSQLKLIDEPLRIMIVGEGKSGKSSLLNYILGENRAIVTEIAGTTRDVIEEFVNIKGIPLKIVDTAGIRETEDIVEKIGVEKSKESLNSADLVIIVLDSSKELTDEDREILEQAVDKKTILLLNNLSLLK